jgi:methylated-DNA-[protein]-cysteine S-methyltransferase
MEKHYCMYQTEIGELLIAEKSGVLTDVISYKDLSSPFNGIHLETPLLQKTALQLEEYLRGERREFDIPLAPEGTSFQQQVWKALLDIPYGETRSYKDIAVAVGNPKAMRAVGMANHHNPISFIIPCHRVIGANGSLVGYGGGLELKKKLLDLEKAFLNPLN